MNVSQTKAHPDNKQQSRHEEVVVQTAETRVDPVPVPDEGGHAHSHAAHLKTAGNIHTEAVGSQKQGVEPGALRQPASIAQRNGKQHR